MTPIKIESINEAPTRGQKPTYSNSVISNFLLLFLILQPGNPQNSERSRSRRNGRSVWCFVYREPTNPRHFGNALHPHNSLPAFAPRFTVLFTISPWHLAHLGALAFCSTLPFTCATCCRWFRKVAAKRPVSIFETIAFTSASS